MPRPQKSPSLTNFSTPTTAGYSEEVKSVEQSPYRQRRTYYRLKDVLVTESRFEAAGRRFQIDQLSELMRARSGPHPGVLVGLSIATCEAALGLPLAAFGGTVTSWFSLIVLLAVPCSVSLFCSLRWPPRFELLGRYRGVVVTLFISSDEREFGQVARAVHRSLEAALNGS
jgi:hypothetical protein